MTTPSKKSSRRPEMLAQVIREIIAPVLRECPPECSILSITSVDVSSDLSYVTAYISSLREPQKALQFLEERTGDLKKKLAKLQLRRVPTLRFRLDPLPAKGERIDILLSESQLMSDDSSASVQDEQD